MDISRDANKTCSFCGHRTATAQWGHDVFCCPHCAIEILPKFMADARHFPEITAFVKHQ